MIGITPAAALTYLLGLAALCPGLALLHLARKAAWPLVPTLLGLALLLVPVVVVAVAPGSLAAGLQDRARAFGYALWFLPGLIVWLDSVGVRGLRLGVGAGLLALAPYLLFVAASAGLGTGAVGAPIACCAAAVLTILLLRAERYRLPARLIGIVLMLLPLAMPLVLRLPDHLAMAEACRAKAGALLAAAPGPVTEIALDLGERGCEGVCMALLAGGDIRSVEAPGGARPPHAALPQSRFYRYRLGRPGETAAGSEAGPGGEACLREMRLKDGARCVMARPIEAYGVDFLIRHRGAAAPGAAVVEQAFEIVDLRHGEAVVWTAAYFMPRSPRRDFYDVPLELVMARRGRCETNGPPLATLIERFLGGPER